MANIETIYNFIGLKVSYLSYQGKGLRSTGLPRLVFNGTLDWLNHEIHVALEGRGFVDCCILHSVLDCVVLNIVLNICIVLY